jgi:di/tricarboxylate transporter
MTSRGSKSSVADATPAMFMIFVIFALPTQYRFWPFRTGSEKPESSPGLITWDIIERRLPWGVLLFVGGGFALSDACTKTGNFGTFVTQPILIENRKIFPELLSKNKFGH